MNKNQSHFLMIIFAVIALAVILWFTGVVPRSIQNSNMVCTMDAMKCSDGSYVSRTGPNCSFAECPNPTPTQLEGWMTAKDSINSISFQYPKELQATYIHTVDWPPKAAISNAVFTCNNAGLVTIINGQQYCITKVSEGAAGSTYTNYSYVTQEDGKLVTLTFSLRFPQCGNYNDPQKTACENERTAFSLDSVVDRIFGTMTVSSIVSSDSGIKGTVYYGPTCPVLRDPPDAECADRPYAVSLVAKDSAGRIVSSFTSNAQGDFSASLSPGTYTIEKAGSSMFPRCSGGPVTVSKGVYVLTPVYCDSGIR